MEEKREKEYICPHCKRLQTSVNSHEEETSIYEYFLEDGKFERTDVTWGERIRWACPECDKDIPDEIVEELNISF